MEKLIHTNQSKERLKSERNIFQIGDNEKQTKEQI